MKQMFQANNGANTVRLAVTTSSKRIALPAQTPSSTIRIYNNGSAIAYIQFGDVTITATVPTADSTGGSMPIGSGITEVQGNSLANTYVSGITASGTADIYFTVGEGV